MLAASKSMYGFVDSQTCSQTCRVQCAPMRHDVRYFMRACVAKMVPNNPDGPLGPNGLVEA